MAGKTKTKKKPSALAAAASRKLSQIGNGGGQRQFSPEQVAHMMMHAEESGDAERVPLDDGTWGWKMAGPNGQMQILKPTPEMLEALERFEREGHPAHDHD